MAEAERVRQQHLLSGRGYEQTLGDRRKGKPGLLQSTGSQRFRHDLVTEQEEEVMSRITSSSLFSRASLIAQLVKNLPAMQETPVRFLVGKILWRRTGYPRQYSWSSLMAQLAKNPPAMWET